VITQIPNIIEYANAYRFASRIGTLQYSLFENLPYPGSISVNIRIFCEMILLTAVDRIARETSRYRITYRIFVDAAASKMHMCLYVHASLHALPLGIIQYLGRVSTSLLQHRVINTRKLTRDILDVVH